MDQAAKDAVYTVMRIVDIFREAELAPYINVEQMVQEGDKLSLDLTVGIDHFDLTVEPNREVVWNDFSHSVFLFKLNDHTEDAVLDLKFNLARIQAWKIRSGPTLDMLCDHCGGDLLLCLSIKDAAQHEGTVTLDVRALGYELVKVDFTRISYIRNIQELATQWCRVRGYELVKVEHAN